jgi:DNA repair photolyase
VEEPCFIVLEKLLNAENDVLITTKPRLLIIQAICDKFLKYQDKMQFRFTIGSKDNKKLEFWEPGAPDFEERLSALQYTFKKGFRTSISIEPFLDLDPTPLVNILMPFVTDTIWIGIMHYINRNHLSAEEKPMFQEIRNNYTMSNVQKIYTALRENPKIRWKDSIKKMLSL